MMLLLVCAKKLLAITISNFEYLFTICIARLKFNGFLIQERDHIVDEDKKFQVVTKIAPNNKQLKALNLGWKLVRYVKSNAIVFSNNKQLELQLYILN